MHVALAGTLAGLLHVVSGPDHLVAVAPLAMKRPLHGLRIGLTWGVGHASGVILVGLLGVALRSVIDVEVLSRWAEFIVGFVLIGVGVWAIGQMRKVVVHRHPHEHQQTSLAPVAPEVAAVESQVPVAPEVAAVESQLPVASEVASVESPLQRRQLPAPAAQAERHHRHPHPHPEPHPRPNPTPSASAAAGDLQALAAQPSAHGSAHAHLHVHQQGEHHDSRAHSRHHTRGSFAVGLIHGAAGTGHLLGVLPSLALPPLSGLVYLGCYGVAAVVAMGNFGFVMGIIGHRLRPHVLRGVMLSCGILAIGLGFFWLGSAWQNLG